MTTFALVNQLERHIEILLLSNDCVIVPNLGGFVAHHICARYVDDEGLYLPPLRTLGFNAQLKMNDSLLAQSYAEAFDLSLPEALDRIEAEVGEWRQQLADKGEVELASLGRLYINAEGQMAFDPCEAGILTPSLYALSSFEMALLKQQAASVTATDAASAKTVALEAPVATATASTQVETDEAPQDDRVVFIGSDRRGRKTLNISLRAIRNTAVAAVVIAATFLLPAPLSRHGEQFAQGSQSALVTKMRDTVDSMLATKADTAHAKTLPADRQQKIRHNVHRMPPRAKVPQLQSVDKSYYTVVLCSHVSQQGAEMFAQKAAGDGFTGAVATQQDGINKVLYGHFQTQAEAQEALAALRTHDAYKQSWILEVKSPNLK